MPPVHRVGTAGSAASYTEIPTLLRHRESRVAAQSPQALTTRAEMRAQATELSAAQTAARKWTAQRALGR